MHNSLKYLAIITTGQDMTSQYQNGEILLFFMNFKICNILQSKQNIWIKLRWWRSLMLISHYHTAKSSGFRSPLNKTGLSLALA